MPYKFSRCVAFHTPERDRAVAFYTELLGLPRVEYDNKQIELKAGENRLFLDDGEAPQVVFEFMVPDLQKARDELERQGCTVVRWEGKGGANYIRDPFGLMFNLWEDKSEFI